MTIGELLAAGKLEERPDPDWVRGKCPLCGAEVVSNAVYVGSKGYVVIWECWRSIQDGSCDYRRVL
jgi:hypothetical protein